MSVKCFKFCIILYSTVLHISNGGQKPLDVKHYLYQYGILNTTDADKIMLQKGLKIFQRFNRLAVTGTLSQETKDKMNSPRCGRPSGVPTFAIPYGRWISAALTYSLRNKTSSLPETAIQRTLEESIRKWTSKVNLKIIESTSNTADINVHFAEIDGPDAIIGYAYYPQNGSIFFDIDERWTTDDDDDSKTNDNKINFAWVVQHELGHSLGLRHNMEDPSSIMYPYYVSTVSEPSEADINTLQDLYGAKFDNSMLCKNTSVDAVLDGVEPILLRKSQYWTFAKKSLQYGPFFVDGLFPGLPEKVDAALAVRSTSYFFCGNVFYKFKRGSRKHTRKLISKGFGGVPDDVDAAFFDKNDTIYFFKSTKYYAFSITRPLETRLIVSGRSISADWGGIPNNVEAATLFGKNEALFIKNGNCYIANISSKELVKKEECSLTMYKC